MVYLIHFKTPYKHAGHYLGFSTNGWTLKTRLIAHGNGEGAALMRAVSQAGIEWEVVRKWKGSKHDRTFERGLHNQKNNPRLCPICNTNVKIASLTSRKRKKGA